MYLSLKIKALQNVKELLNGHQNCRSAVVRKYWGSDGVVKVLQISHLANLATLPRPKDTGFGFDRRTNLQKIIQTVWLYSNNFLFQPATITACKNN